MWIFILPVIKRAWWFAALMHTVCSIELHGHQRHLTGSAEPEVMQSHWPHFQWYLNPFLHERSGQLANHSSAVCALLLIWCVRNVCVSAWVCRCGNLMWFVKMCVRVAILWSLIHNLQSARQTCLFFFLKDLTEKKGKKRSLSLFALKEPCSFTSKA